MMLAKEKIKRNRGKYFDSCIKIKYIKVKDIGPSQREAEVVMLFLVLYAQSLNAKERHLILTLMISTFIM